MEGIPITPFPPAPSGLFELPSDVLLQVLQCLKVEDTSRMDVAVSAKSARMLFLTLIASKLFTSNSENIKHRLECLVWMCLRGINFNDITFSSVIDPLPVVDDIQLEQLVTLRMIYGSSQPAKKLLTNIASKCKKLSSLTITGSPDAWHHLETILGTNKNIRDLCIDACGSREPVCLQTILRTCNNLVSLIIKADNFSFSTEENVVPIPSLTELRIKSAGILWESFDDYCLLRIAEAAPNLETISLERCLELTNQGYSSLASKCPHIRHLKVEDTPSHINIFRILRSLITPSLVTIAISAGFSQKLSAEDIQELQELFTERGGYLQKISLKLNCDMCPLATTILSSCTSLIELVLIIDGGRMRVMVPLTLPTETICRIKSLRLEGVYALSDIAAAIKHFPGLVELRLFNSPLISAKDILTLCTLCTKLEILQLNSVSARPLVDSTDAVVLATLDSLPPIQLKSLALRCTNEAMEFTNSLLKCCPELETLSLDDLHGEFESPEIQAFLVAITQDCPKLKHLTFSRMSDAMKKQIQSFLVDAQSEIRIRRGIFADIY